MGAKADLVNEQETILTGMDSIVIRNYLGGIMIKAGHIVIRDTENDTYKPMPVNSAGTAYESLPSNHEYVGVVVCSKPADKPFVGIMYAGEVNDVASPYPIDSI